MALNQEMRRLSETHSQQYDNRMDAVHSIKTNAANTMANIEDAHRKLASDLRRHMENLESNREQMARNLRDHLSHFHRDLADNVKCKVADLEHAHEKRASEIGHRLQEMGASREQMGAEQQHRLEDEHARLAAAVDQMRNELQTEIGEAQQIWGEHLKEMHHKRMAHSRTSPTTHRQSRSATATAHGDDLTVIAGIAAGRQQKLNEIGIHTFADLAHASAQSLREALGSSAHLVNVEEWIQAAKKRM